MAAMRFEGRDPVGRYWLAHCEGFAVEGGAHGVVQELLHDTNPHVTARLLVRTKRGRTRVIPASAIATVSPAERTLVVHERRQKPKPQRHTMKRTWRSIRAAAAWSAARLRPHARAGAAASWPLVRGTAVVLAGSFRRLAAELRATARARCSRFSRRPSGCRGDRARNRERASAFRAPLLSLRPSPSRRM